MRVSLLAALTGAVLAAVGAQSALADTVSSSNWAGFAVHRTGVSFTKVVGSWKQPTAKCTPGSVGYSAVWVGIGGYSETSQALEQIGSEIDCTYSGKVSSTLWYELVPAASVPIKMAVRPGDSLTATVTVNGRKVVMSIRNLTTRKSFSKTLYASVVDVSSAEWIVEAPSNCFSDGSCQTLPLANFGSATFTAASATAAPSTAAGGHTGTIADRAWDASKIRLQESGRRFVAAGDNGSSIGVASPSKLAAGGTSFKVTYSALSVQTNPVATARTATAHAGTGHLVVPGRH